MLYSNFSSTYFGGYLKRNGNPALTEEEKQQAEKLKKEMLTVIREKGVDSPELEQLRQQYLAIFRQAPIRYHQAEQQQKQKEQEKRLEQQKAFHDTFQALCLAKQQKRKDVGTPRKDQTGPTLLSTKLSDFGV